MKNLLLVIAVLLLKFSSAQDGGYDSTATVIVHKDPRVDFLVKKQATINTTVKKSTAYRGRGYRLLVANTTSREEAISAKTKVYTYFPDLKAYLLYQSPYFKLKAGNFRTRDEAARYQKNMNIIFPKGVFIINDIVEIKPEKDIAEEKK
ncbi:MAG: SPOR domain-containing protein [Chitinophagaceae bacterium]|nr:SPOR domain-containing protein [Chitinophagaceae bacterium]